MNAPIESTLTDRLRDAVDGGPGPVSVDGLMHRAHRVRRRRRVARAGVGVVAAATAAVLVVPVLADRAPGRSDVATAPTTVTTATSGLSEAEIVRRCEPQLAKYAALPMYGDSGWRVLHDRDYRVGDVVALLPDRLGPVLCVIPAVGKEADPVPFSRFEPTDDPARLTELCAESESFATAHDAAQWTDLRGADVLALDRTGATAAVLLRQGRNLFSCTLGPLTSDVGLTDVGPAGPRQLNLTATTFIKSLVDRTSVYYFGAGRTEPEVVRLRLTFSDGRTFERPVGDDGAWAVMLEVPGQRRLSELLVEALDEDAVVVDSFRIQG